MKLFEGKLSAEGISLGIIVGKFNSFIGDKLIEGAKDAFLQLGGDENNIDVFKVPGSYEIPGVAKKLVDGKKYDAVICLGVIIQGETPHFEYVAGNNAKAIMELALAGPVPVIYGVITAGNLEEAIDRAGAKMGNKGYTSVMNAVEMVSLYKQIK
jgi:6,7-dimethyl-8-ribityllumazine synthase